MIQKKTAQKNLSFVSSPAACALESQLGMRENHTASLRALSHT